MNHDRSIHPGLPLSECIASGGGRECREAGVVMSQPLPRSNTSSDLDSLGAVFAALSL